MGVQDVVARFNKSKSATTITNANADNNKKILPPPKRKVITTIDNKIFPPSPASSPTSTIHKSSSTSTTGSNNSIASMLQKFNQPLLPTPTNTPPKSPRQQQQPQQQTITSHSTTTPVTTTATRITTTKKIVTPKLLDYEKFDITAIEIEDLFQSLLDQNKAAEEYIEKLTVDVEKYKSDSTKVRDYEIRVEYLALKLEQVSEERDFYEKELLELQQQSNNTKKKQQNNEITESPMSPAYTYQQDIVIEDEEKLQKQNNDAYMEDILNVYEEISEEDNMTYEDRLLEEEQSQSQQQIECDKGMQMAIVKYITDLEQEKLETKRLKVLVKKQDELIFKLEESKLTTPLLKEQVEVQKFELDNKRELLSQLLNERQDLLNRLNYRKSLILLEDFDSNSNRPTSYSSVNSAGNNRVGSPPPLTASPKQPLPSLPH
jgi:hypothetical protein